MLNDHSGNTAERYKENTGKEKKRERCGKSEKKGKKINKLIVVRIL